MPSRMSEDQNEVALSKLLVRMRQIKKVKKHQWFDSNDKIAMRYGLVDLFDITKKMRNTETE